MKVNTKKTTNSAAESYEWLTVPTGRNACLPPTGRQGRGRIETLGWKRLARIYYANRSGSRIRKAINAEARRCGYTPSTILAINAE